MTTSRGAKSLYNICKGLPDKKIKLTCIWDPEHKTTACCCRICKMGGEKKADKNHTEKVFYRSIHADTKLTLASLCLGSFFLAKSRESYTMAKPVVLPPPNWVLKPNTNTTSGVVLYILASFSLISVLGTVALPGCRTSTTYREDGECMRGKFMLTMASKQWTLQRSWEPLPFASSEAADSSWTCGSWLSLCHSEDG